VKGERDARFETLSGEPLKPLYTAADLAGTNDAEIGYPGEYPFTRGVYPSMYRGRLWTMRLVSGWRTAEESNERYRYLLEHGQTGLSTVFDMPTLMGFDSDHPRSRGEGSSSPTRSNSSAVVCRCGAAGRARRRRGELGLLTAGILRNHG
jgi:methylmalonyl-CoA mutase N-terminal domain/subunit